MSNIKTLYDTIQKFKTKEANERALTKAIGKGVSTEFKPMYHGTGVPGGFAEVNPYKGEGFLHAGTMDQAIARLIDTGAAKDGMIMPIYADIKNPFRMNDAGAWGPRGFLEDKNFSSLIDDTEKGKFEQLRKALAKAGSAPVDHNPNPEIITEAQKLHKETAFNVKDALNKRGYDAIKYRNLVEGHPSNMKTANALQKLIAEAEKIGDKEAVERYMENLATLYQDSYALLPDTTVRRVDAKFDPKKFKTRPNDLLAGVGGVAAGSMLMPDQAKADDGSAPFTGIKFGNDSDTESDDDEPGVISNALEAWDNATGKPARKHAYDAVMPIPYAPKENPSGQDIFDATVEQGRRVFGSEPDNVKQLRTPVSMLLDAGLDYSNIIPAAAIAKGIKKVGDFKNIKNVLKK